MAHITYDRTKPFGKMTAEWIDTVLAVRELADRLKTAMDEITAGGVTPANLESGDGAANFGVPVGQGANFYNGIVSIRAGLNAISATTIGDLDLGG